MIKNVFFCLLTFILIQPSLCQIDDLKDAADDNNKSYHSGNDHSSSGSDIGDACIDVMTDECMNVCFDFLLSNLFDAMDEWHKLVLDKKEEQPEVTSFHFSYHTGIGLQNFITTHVPHIRGNYGIYSMDLRYKILYENGENFNAWEWQFFILNIINTPTLITRVGNGLYFEQYTGKCYHEMMLDFEFYSRKKLPGIFISSRLAYDYSTGNNPFFEINVTKKIPLIKNEHFTLSASPGLIYQNYYSRIDLFFLQLGIFCTID